MDYLGSDFFQIFPARTIFLLLAKEKVDAELINILLLLSDLKLHFWELAFPSSTSHYIIRTFFSFFYPFSSFPFGLVGILLLYNIPEFLSY